VFGFTTPGSFAKNPVSQQPAPFIANSPKVAKRLSHHLA